MVLSRIGLYTHDFVIVIFRVLRLALLPLASSLPAPTTKVLTTSAKLLATAELLATEVEFELLSRNTWNDEAL